MKIELKLKRALKELCNKKSREWNKQIQENLAQYREEQPVIDLERQLAGEKVEIKVTEPLERQGLNPLHLAMINAVMIRFCAVEDISPKPKVRRKHPAIPHPSTKDQEHVSNNSTTKAFFQALKTMCVRSSDERLKICFICLGNANLPLKKWIEEYATSGSLTRHFLQSHVNPPWPAGGVECNVCKQELLKHRGDLLLHAEKFHGTVV
ncbi:hypothetical protein BDW68DRAFT_188545 [Aspergillus falconensis]